MRILVTGATGGVGRLVVDELVALGAQDIRALTVDPSKARLPDGVEAVRGYLGRPSTLPAALAGVDRMYLAPLVKTNAEVCRLAAAAGVRRIVDLAGAKGGHWQPIEDGVEACGVPYVHLEPGEFMSNAETWAPQIRAGDVVRDGYGKSGDAPIAHEDIATVAARCLVEEGHEGLSYELSGPETLTRQDRVAQLGAALGRDLTYIDLPHDEFVAHLAQTMGDFATWYADGMAAMIDHPQRPVPTMPQILGRPGTTFASWARDHVDTFR
ncbi:NAD(P)H-binding protein [Winogradskya consettensis]|uniref:Nucleotide-diphosphate-sugar epimerase n=1 Tax=Winogradskya consettensis TaxID=113560 RepID=A0A919SDK4_9ACTN|nr:NAD(P)H-binding protein [Actinoplanes consettensis]GIM68672.1 nucleotide-diphosphate-sugar epimerase [Actinoplanes consettensis]